MLSATNRSRSAIRMLGFMDAPSEVGSLGGADGGFSARERPRIPPSLSRGDRDAEEEPPLGGAEPFGDAEARPEVEGYAEGGVDAHAAVDLGGRGALARRMARAPGRIDRQLEVHAPRVARRRRLRSLRARREATHRRAPPDHHRDRGAEAQAVVEARAGEVDVAVEPLVACVSEEAHPLEEALLEEDVAARREAVVPPVARGAAGRRRDEEVDAGGERAARRDERLPLEVGAEVSEPAAVEVPLRA